MSKQKKRFIAGAKCPKCGKLDTVVYQMLENIGHIECVSCGHQQTEADDQVADLARTNEQVIGVFKPD